jgi:large subunit ribosomal protein L15
MRQDELAPAPGSRRKRKRRGHGLGSGHGRYSGRGIKGQKARSGGKIPPYFEGGQLPLVKRLPSKRGFSNIFKTKYAIVNVGKLKVFEPGAIVTPQELVKARLVKSQKVAVKILGDGEINHPLVVKGDKFSAVAKEKIEAVGGRVEEIRSAAKRR